MSSDVLVGNTVEKIVLHRATFGQLEVNDLFVHDSMFFEKRKPQEDCPGTINALCLRNDDLYWFDAEDEVWTTYERMGG